MRTSSAHSIARFIVPFAVLFTGLSVSGKEQLAQTLTWPETGTAVLRFTFGKFKEVGSLATQRSYVIDTTAENLWSKQITDASFLLYLYDKNKVRTGEGWISVNNVGPGQIVKFTTTLGATGNPVSMSLVARHIPPELGLLAPPKMVSITVNSVPQGRR